MVSLCNFGTRVMLPSQDELRDTLLLIFSEKDCEKMVLFLNCLVEFISETKHGSLFLGKLLNESQ